MIHMQLVGQYSVSIVVYIVVSEAMEIWHMLMCLLYLGLNAGCGQLFSSTKICQRYASTAYRMQMYVKNKWYILNSL